MITVGKNIQNAVSLLEQYREFGLGEQLADDGLRWKDQTAQGQIQHLTCFLSNSWFLRMFLGSLNTVDAPSFQHLNDAAC